jgi:AcrR family transcriptional regulator
MPADTLNAFEPRKTPVQARSAVTVEAISEAAIQVLLSHGGDRLTTTLVAERAGVSVGTLYQYYPNKEALLFAVLEAAMSRMTAAVETACEQVRHKPLADMIKNVVEAFVEAKMSRPDISVALYQISANVGGPALVKKALQRQRKALDAMLQTAPDTDAPPDKFTIEIMCAAMAGAMKSVLETGPTPALVRKLREQLVLLCQSYMAAATKYRRCRSSIG